jgi:PAS domain S-box-containing protein
MASKIIHAGAETAAGASRSHMLRAAGFEVIEAGANDGLVHLAAKEHANVIVLEPGAADAQALRREIAANAVLPRVEIIELSNETRTSAAQTATGELGMAVRALLDLNATEQALRESDARFSSVADSAPVMMWMSGPDKQFTYLSQPWFDFTGRSPTQALGAGWRERVHPDDAEQCQAVYERAFAQRVDFEMEYRLRHRDGDYRWVLDRGVPRYTPDGVFAGYIGSCLDITERRAVAEALRRSEAQLQLATSAAEMGLWAWSVTGEELVWNERCKALFGIEHTAAVTRERFLAAVHEEDRPHVEEALRFALETGTDYKVEFRIVLPDGTMRWIAVRARSRRDDAGARGEMTGVAWDVTARKRAEESLRISEHRFRSLIEYSNDLIVIFNEDRSMRYVSGSVVRILGYNTEEFLQMPAFGPLHADDAAATAEAFAQALARPSEPVNLQHRCQHTDGSWRWLEGTITNYLQEMSIRGVIGNFRDVTERKNAEVDRERLLKAEVALRELDEAAERRSALLAEISDALTSMDYQSALKAVVSKAVPALGDCCIIDVLGMDGKLERVARACADPRVQKLLDEHAGTSSDQLLLHAIAHVTLTGKPMVVENTTEEAISELGLDEPSLTRLRESGVHAFFVVPLIAYGERLGALSVLLLEPTRRYVARDVRLAQEFASRIAMGVRNAMLFADAERARTQAEEASRVKDEFLAIVSHELRQPVHAIAGWLRLLRTGKLPADKAEHALDTIHQNVILQGQIVNDLLDVSGMITGQLHLDVKPLQLDSVIAAAVETLKPAAGAKHITLQLDLDANTGMFMGDPKRLQQVVWNLLSNAVKFTPRGGTVRVELCRVDDTAHITVNDNGPGIDPEFLPYVFDRFRQQDSTTTRKFGGLGLGLAIVRHVVEMHGGTVQASNAPEGGARFAVHLPYRSAHQAGVATAPRS